MIASERARAVQARSGPRPLDPSRDLAQVADLIDAAFGEDMDEEGRRVLQEMRAMSHAGPLLWLLFHTSYEFREAFGGYVWEEEGRIVGNVTLSTVSPGADRWQISNVAVDEAYRRRGIARRLMHLALADARRQGGTWALLQVRHDNEAALALYRSLGFETLGGETFMDWRGRPPMPLQALEGQAAGADVVVRPIRPEEWPAELDLARAAVPPLMQWARPLRAHRFRRTATPAWWAALGRWFSGREDRLVGAFQGERLLARLHLRVDHRAGRAALRVLVATEARGQVEEALLQEGLARLPGGRRLQVEARFPMELTTLREALEGLGFRHRRTLLHMRRDLSRGVPALEGA
ncbi:MAG: GNAT family N-acetyltransferase [Anaerolineae bacterium]|nr:GNAT family N-acetyltransferase [Anaerolineae bacterium]